MLGLLLESGGFHLRFGRGSLGLGRKLRRRFVEIWPKTGVGLGWVVEARVWVGEESNSLESGRTPKLWVGGGDGAWGGDDVRYHVFVVLRFEIFMFKC